MIRPSPQYNVENEAQFRAQVEAADLKSVKTDRAAPFVLLSQADGAVYRVEVVAGALVVTAV